MKEFCQMGVKGNKDIIEEEPDENKIINIIYKRPVIQYHIKEMHQDILF